MGEKSGKLAEQSNGGFQSLGQALTFSTTSMTGSGGFTPGTPVSTLFKRLSKRYNEKIHKDYKKNINRLETFNFCKTFSLLENKTSISFPLFLKKKKKKKKKS